MSSKPEQGSNPQGEFSILPYVITAILALLVYSLVLVDRMGFCYKRLWFMSDEELILNSLDDWMKSGRMKLGVTDTDASAYLAHHPECCKVVWGDSGVFGRGFMFWNGSAEVQITFERAEEHMGDQEKIFSKTHTLYYKRLINKTACGEYLDDIGRGFSRPIEPTDNQSDK